MTAAKEQTSLSAPEQVDELGRLRQAAAARLLGVHSKTLRDNNDAPRNRDGSYDGPALVQWFLNRAEPAKLTDQETEMALLVIDAIESGMGIGGAIEVIRELKARHGNAGLLAFVGLLVEDMQATDQVVSGSNGADGLSHKYVCPQCRKVRVGRTWVKTTGPAKGTTYELVCPRCEE